LRRAEGGAKFVWVFRVNVLTCFPKSKEEAFNVQGITPNTLPTVVHD
jgi:hypothetical protein